MGKKSDNKELVEEKDNERISWKATAIVLGILAICLIVRFSIQDYNKLDEWKNDVCINMERFKVGTPSWFNEDGYLVKEGYGQIIPNIENESEREEYYNLLREAIRNNFINQRISFLYNDNCAWCDKQIGELKEVGIWEEYQESKLTINCTK